MTTTWRDVKQGQIWKDRDDGAQVTVSKAPTSGTSTVNVKRTVKRAVLVGTMKVDVFLRTYTLVYGQSHDADTDTFGQSHGGAQ